LSTSKKGIVFSIDALLAVILISIFTASIAFLSSSSSGDNPWHLLEKKQASDMLISMDKAGLFAGMGQNRINMTLESMLPPGTGYSLNVDYYSQYGDEFSQVAGTSYLRGNMSGPENIGSSQRNFVVARQGQHPLYGVARLSIWKGS
jgi:hypothetical protein